MHECVYVIYKITLFQRIETGHPLKARGYILTSQTSPHAGNPSPCLIQSVKSGTRATVSSSSLHPASSPPGWFLMLRLMAHFRQQDWRRETLPAAPFSFVFGEKIVSGGAVNRHLEKTSVDRGVLKSIHKIRDSLWQDWGLGQTLRDA